jgi:hypothetical protein
MKFTRCCTWPPASHTPNRRKSQADMTDEMAHPERASPRAIGSTASRRQPRLGLVVRHEDVEMDAIAWPARRVHLREQIDRHRPDGSSRSSSPTS